MSTRGPTAEEGGRGPKRARSSASSAISVFPRFTRAAMVVRPDTYVETWDDAWDIVQRKSGIPLFFDAERKKLILPLCHKLDRLDHGNLHGNGCCRLVLGAKGLGKTTLLMLLAAANAHMNARTMCVYVQSPQNALIDNYSLMDVLRDSVNTLLSGDSGDEADFGDVDTLLDWLTARQRGQRRLFLIVDEVDELFKVKEGGAWIRDLRRLANLGGERQVYVVVSGSSAHLRSLFYALLPRESASVYPGYDGISCNNTKFRPIALRRPQTINDFRPALKALSPGDEIGDDELTRLFIDSQGSLRDAQASLEGEDVSTGAYVFEKVRANARLRALYSRMFNRIVSDNMFDVARDFGKTCSFDDLVASHGDGEWEHPARLSFLYQCADEGYIDMTPNGYSGDTEVSFPHPAFYAMASSLDSGLAFEEVVALLYPFSRHGEVVERLVLESFAQANGYEWKSKVLRCTQAGVRKEDGVDLKGILGREQVENAVYKAANDCGVDGVAVKRGDDGTVEMVCIQVKMQGIDASSSRGIWKRQEPVLEDGGSARGRGGGTVDDMVEKMRAVGTEIESYCGPDRSVRLELCLVTNRDVSEPARGYLAQQYVKLVDRRGLYEMYSERVRTYVDRNRLAVHGFDN